MSKNREVPEVLFVGARSKVKHRRTVFQILSRKDGLPCECRMIQDHETIHLEGGEEFMTAYVPDVMFEEKP